MNAMIITQRKIRIDTADPTIELTGDRRVDRVILRRAARMSHGTKEQRMENFRSGLEGGAGACFADLAGLN